MTGSEARAPFITFEGIDGAGKTTQLESYCHFLQSRGTPFERTRESRAARPPVSACARWCSNDTAGDGLLVMFAALRHVRAAHPRAITAGRWVVCDRFSDASYAYQVGGRGVDAARFALIGAGCWEVSSRSHLPLRSRSGRGGAAAQARHPGAGPLRAARPSFLRPGAGGLSRRAAREPGASSCSMRPVREALSQQVIAEVQRRWPS